MLLSVAERLRPLLNPYFYFIFFIKKVDESFELPVLLSLQKACETHFNRTEGTWVRSGRLQGECARTRAPVATPAEFVELWKVMMVRCLCWRSQQSSVSRAARVDGWCQATQEQAWFLPTTDKCCPQSLIQHRIILLQKLYLLQQSSTLDTCILWYCHIFLYRNKGYISPDIIYVWQSLWTELLSFPVTAA